MHDDHATAADLRAEIADLRSALAELTDTVAQLQGTTGQERVAPSPGRPWAPESDQPTEVKPERELDRRRLLTRVRAGGR